MLTDNGNFPESTCHFQELAQAVLHVQLYYSTGSTHMGAAYD